jgi:hypothetical protein
MTLAQAAELLPILCLLCLPILLIAFGALALPVLSSKFTKDLEDSGYFDQKPMRKESNDDGE